MPNPAKYVEQKFYQRSDGAIGIALNDEGGLIMKRAERHFLIVFMSWVLLAPNAQAERAFYHGKNVNFVINFAAGGPTDIEGRIVARHLAKHIAGNPTIIVQNMPGAG